MSVNIACSVIECTAPVIGQCTGYKKTCGRYYCRKHSLDSFCADCSSRKSADILAQKVYKEYLALAENLFREPVSVSEFKFQPTNLSKIGDKSKVIGVILFIPLLLIGIVARIIDQQFSQSIIENYTILILGSFILMTWSFILIPIQRHSHKTYWVYEEEQKRRVERASEIEKEKPGFLKFWNAWVQQRNDEQVEKNKQILMGILTVAGAIVAIGLSAATYESDYDRTRRAVRDEMNKN